MSRFLLLGTLLLLPLFGAARTHADDEKPQST